MKRRKTKTVTGAAQVSQVRSGHIRVFNVHIQSRLLWRTLVTGTGTDLRRDKKKKGGGGNKEDRLHWRVQGSTSSPTEVGSRRRVFEVLWNLECPVGLSQKRNMCAFQ